MLQLEVRSLSRIGKARREVRHELNERGVTRDEVERVEIVVGELLGAAYEAHADSPVVVTVEYFARIVSVRVRCPHSVTLRDEPFDMRERVLNMVTLAFGERRNPDGTIDLWAEIPREPAARQ